MTIAISARLPVRVDDDVRLTHSWAYFGLPFWWCWWTVAALALVAIMVLAWSPTPFLAATLLGVGQAASLQPAFSPLACGALGDCDRFWGPRRLFYRLEEEVFYMLGIAAVAPGLEVR